MNQQNSEQHVFLSNSVFEIKVGNYSPGLFYKFCSNCFSTSNKKFGLGPMIIWNSSRIFSIHLLYFRNRRLNLSTKFLGWFGSDWEHWDKLRKKKTVVLTFFKSWTFRKWKIFFTKIKLFLHVADNSKVWAEPINLCQVSQNFDRNIHPETLWNILICTYLINHPN